MRVALVIGLASYGSTAAGGLGSLSGPHLHAGRMQKKLLELAAFDTILHCDFFGEPQSTHQGLYGAIQEFRDKLAQLASKGDKDIVAFFYYSGHGAYNGKHHYLLPNDSQRGIAVDLQGIDFEDSILHHMAKHASLSIAVLDCCRTGDGHHQGAIPMLQVPPGHQYLVCHACPPFRRAPDNGMYTNALLQHIFKSDRSFMELVGEANKQVAAEGEQQPHMGATISFPPGFILVTQVGWRFFQKRDIEGHDIAQAEVDRSDGIGNVKQLAKAAEGHGMTAVAFNTQGHIKHTAGELVDMPVTRWLPKPAGVFVRDATVPRDWLYFPLMDSTGGDMRPNMRGTVFEMALEAAERGAVAFNTDGWAKYDIKPFHAWKQEAVFRSLDGKNGIFVRVSNPLRAHAIFL